MRTGSSSDVPPKQAETRKLRHHLVLAGHHCCFLQILCFVVIRRTMDVYSEIIYSYSFLFSIKIFMFFSAIG